MGRVNSIFKVILVVLLVIVVFEFGFYFYLNNSKKTQPEEINLPPRSVDVTEIKVTEVDPKIAINPQTRKLMDVRFSLYKKDILKKSILYNEIQGEIVEVVTTPWVSPDGTVYDNALILKSPTNTYNYVDFHKDELKKLQVTLTTAKDTKGVTLIDLKPKDIVIIKETVDLLAETYYKGSELLTIDATRR